MPTDSPCRARLCRSMIEYAVAVKAENEFRRRNQCSLDEYLSFCPDASGVQMMFDLVELDPRRSCIAPLSNESRVAAKMAGLVVSLDNDLISRHKDLSSGALDIFDGIGACNSDSIADVVVWRNQLSGLIYRQLLDAETEHERGYLTGVLHWAHGSLDWQLRSVRYSGHDITIERHRSLLSAHVTPVRPYSFHVPPVATPKFGAEVATSVERKSLEWAESQGLLVDGKLNRIWRNLDLGSAVSVMYPSQDNLDRLQICSDFLGWIFLVDDILEGCADMEPFEQFMRWAASCEPSAPRWSESDRALATHPELGRRSRPERSVGQPVGAPATSS